MPSDRKYDTSFKAGDDYDIRVGDDDDYDIKDAERQIVFDWDRNKIKLKIVGILERKTIFGRKLAGYMIANEKTGEKEIVSVQSAKDAFQIMFSMEETAGIELTNAIYHKGKIKVEDEKNIKHDTVLKHEMAGLKANKLKRVFLKPEEL